MDFIEVLSYYPSVTITGAVIIGLLVGSFLNVVIYRYPIMMENDWKEECRIILEIEDTQTAEQQSDNKRFNLAYPNSHCPHCNTAIKPWHNIPVLSYIQLKGRCANCQTGISPRYPIIEAVTGLLSGIIAWHFGATLQTLLALLFLWSLISLTMIDADHKYLPDQITLPLLWLGLLANSLGLYTSLNDAVWGAIAGYMSLWSVYWAFLLITKKEGMGFGDFKLLAALGAWMGWQALPVIILLSALVGSIIGSIILIINKQGRDTQLPFGPYLAAAGLVAFIWGDKITHAYLRFVGLA